MSLLIRPLLINGNATRQLVLCTRNLAAAKKVRSPAAEKMRKLQEKFQKDDGVPVFLKGGPMDKMMFQATLGLSALGLILNLVLFAGYIIA